MLILLLDRGSALEGSQTVIFDIPLYFIIIVSYSLVLRVMIYILAYPNKKNVNTMDRLAIDLLTNIF